MASTGKSKCWHTRGELEYPLSQKNKRKHRRRTTCVCAKFYPVSSRDQLTLFEIGVSLAVGRTGGVTKG